MTTPAALPNRVDIDCPICGSTITLSVEWQAETGEFGSILSRYPVVVADHEMVDQHDYCHCDFRLSYIEAIAEYYNKGDRLEKLLFPPEEPEKSTIRPEKMSLDELERLSDLITLAEGYAFDAFDLVEHSGHPLEKDLESTIMHTANALDRVERFIRRLKRREARERETTSLVQTLRDAPPDLIVVPKVEPEHVLEMREEDKRQGFIRQRPKYEPS